MSAEIPPPLIRLSLEQKTMLGFLAAMTILLGISFASLYYLHRTNANNYWVEHTHEVIENLQECNRAQLEVEVGVRSYILNHDSQSWQIYENGESRFARSLNTVEQLTLDNPIQQDRLKHLRPLVSGWRAQVDKIARGSFQTARKNLVSTSHLDLLNSINELTEEMREIERNLLVNRQGREAHTAGVLERILILSSLSAILFVGLASFYIHRDILARQRAETTLRHRTEELQILNRELESFSYSVSHDLRTPLRGIVGFSQVLQENYKNKLDAEGQSYLDRIIAATRRMGQLIDGLLNLSRITRKPIQHQTVDLAVLARKIADGLQRDSPHRKSLWRISESLPVIGDPDLLEIALQNLLENAWKFTGKKPEAVIELGLQQNRAGRVYFIRDNGAGFDMTYLQKLFEAFQRLHQTAEFPGTGIGLATVQRIIRRHGGQTWAEGKVNEGAVFYFTLP